MKKLLAFILSFSMLITVLSACNSDSENKVSEDDIIQENVEADDGKLNLVVDGASKYVIVRGENAYISEITATTELQSYLKQITGVEIPIVTDSAEASEYEIVVGKTNRETDGMFDRSELGDDGLVIKTVGEKLFLVGGEQRGTLYSVYEFLEAYAGCRFYTNTFEIVPSMTTLSIDEIAEDKQIPVFTTRVTNWTQQNGGEYKPKRKLSGGAIGSTIPEEFGGSEVWTGHGAGHTINFMIGSGGGADDNPCLTSDDNYQKF